LFHPKHPGVRPIVFTGCLFENLQEGLTESTQLGFGIDAFESRVEVLPGCPTPPAACDPANHVNTLFRNLDHGVHATAAGGINTWLTVERATFRDNVCGVYAAGLHAPSITACEMEMGGLDLDLNTSPYENNWFNYHRAIYTTDCYGLRIQDNHVFRSTAGQSTSVAYEGIVVGYTRDNNEVVFRNTVEGAENGFVGEGVCVDNTIEAGEYLSKIMGLQFHCNTNVGNTMNILSRVAVTAEGFEWPYHSIRGFQGGYQLAAGNVFDQNPSGEHRDFFMNTVWEYIINPFYDDAFVAQEPIYNTYGEPSLPDPSVLVYVMPVAVDAAAANACNEGPGGLPGGRISAGQLQEYRTQYANVRFLYEQLLDGGNTDETVQAVMDTWPQDVWDLRAALLAGSPFLSTEVLKTLWEQGFVPLAIKAEILIANPDGTRSNGFMPWAEQQADPPLPAYLVAAIEASWDQRTYRSHLQEQMAFHHARYSQATFSLLRQYQAANDMDSVLWAWQQLRTPAARFAEALWSADLGHFASADSLLLAMDAEKALSPAVAKERDRLRSYLGLRAAAALGGRSVHELDMGELEALEDLYENGYDRAGVWAALLYDRYGSQHLPLHTGGGAVEKSFRNRGRKERLVPTTSTGHVQVYPNPAQYWAAMDYHLPEGVRQGTLLVRDATGREVARLAASGAQGQRLWDTRRAQPGLYTVELHGDGHRLASTKLIVGQ
jgi:hypothetical protein